MLISISHNPTRILTHKIIKKDMTKLSYETIERIEGLIDQKELQRFKESIQYIAGDLEDEGFELSDVKAYLQMELNELLGDQ